MREAEAHVSSQDAPSVHFTIRRPLGFDITRSAVLPPSSEPVAPGRSNPSVRSCHPELRRCQCLPRASILEPMGDLSAAGAEDVESALVLCVGGVVPFRIMTPSPPQRGKPRICHAWLLLHSPRSWACQRKRPIPSILGEIVSPSSDIAVVSHNTETQL